MAMIVMALVKTVLVMLAAEAAGRLVEALVDRLLAAVLGSFAA